VHAAVSFETSPAICKKQPFASFDENSDISFLIETFRGLIAPFTPFYTPHVVHAAVSVEEGLSIRKTEPFLDFDENTDISLLIETFGSLPLFSHHLARRT
jgi:hypothetical protein